MALGLEPIDDGHTRVTQHLRLGQTSTTDDLGTGRATTSERLGRSLDLTIALAETSLLNLVSRDCDVVASGTSQRILEQIQKS